jgi:tetratricopeptide (TPR) repeat protein
MKKTMTARTIFLAGTLFLAVAIVTAQPVKPINNNTIKKPAVENNLPPVPQVNQNLIVYKNAISLGDLATAISALHYAIASGVGPAYQDTLAMLYAGVQSYQQSYVLSNMILSASPSNATILEVKSLSAMNLGKTTEAIDGYRTLFNSSKKPDFGIQIFTMEYQLGRYKECITTCNQVMASIKNPDSAMMQVPKPDGKTAQVVLATSFVQNAKAMALAEGEKNYAEAKQILEAILIANPDYEQAKNNLAYVVSFINGTNKVNQPDKTPPVDPKKNNK